MPHAGFLRSCGLALQAAGALIIVINAIITPLVPHGDGLAVTVVSPMFLARQLLAAVAAVLLALGAVGLYLRQDDVLRPAGRGALAAAFVSSITLFALEWTQI